VKANFRVFNIPSKGRKTNKKQFYKEIEAFLYYYIVKRRFVGLLCSPISIVCGLFNLKPSFGFIFGGNGLFKFSAPNEELKRGISKRSKQEKQELIIHSSSRSSLQMSFAILI
jgi:hypothetical protein